jgi:hypothetical protein
MTFVISIIKFATLKFLLLLFHSFVKGDYDDT